MRKMVAAFVTAAIAVGTVLGATGCTAKASVTAGAEPPPPPPPPPPPKPEPKPAPAPKQEFKVEGGQLRLPGPVVFETGKDVLKPESDTVLQVVHDYLEAKPDITLLRIEGHTDNDGKADANQTLSEKRAIAVAHWLTGHGTDCKRLIAVGFGQTKPIAGTVDKQTPADKEQNRRVAAVNAGLKGKPIGGLPIDGGGKNAGDPCK
jgi:OOP family OmpA-OmpF porin